jgi:hypothetical protein
MFYVLTKLFHEKTIFCVLSVKKTNFGAKIGVRRNTFLYNT